MCQITFMLHAYYLTFILGSGGDGGGGTEEKASDHSSRLLEHLSV